MPQCLPLRLGCPNQMFDNSMATDAVDTGDKCNPTRGRRMNGIAHRASVT